jgi:hypothetical protein
MKGINEYDFKEKHLILDEVRGIHIPKNFSESIDQSDIINLDPEMQDCLLICLDPDHADYWEAWQHIMDNIKFKLDKTNDVYSLYQDGDLFAVIYKDLK